MSSNKDTGSKNVLPLNSASIELQAIEWVETLAGDTDAQTEQAFDEWMSLSEEHRQAYLEAELLAEGLEQIAAQPDLAKELVAIGDSEIGSYQQPTTTTSEPADATERESIFQKWTAPAMALAASLVLATVVNLMWFNGQDEPTQMTVETSYQSQYHSDLGELKLIELPDGSKLTLGPNSLVKTNFSKTSRTVELVLGEAYFDVVKDSNRPFYVEAELASVKVIGTRFDVRRLAKATSISVVEGVVQVSNGKQPGSLAADHRQSVTLRAGQFAQSDGNSEIVVQQATGLKDLAAWLDGRLVYHGAELRDVLSDANRYSKSGPIRLQNPALGDNKVTLSVNVDSIQELPLMLAELMNLDIQQRSNEIILSRKP